MARTPSKRWVAEVEKAIPRTAKYLHGDPSVSVIDAAMLLSRQHAAFVRLVKKQRESQKFPPVMQNSWYQAACDDILAALQQGGKK